MAPAGSQSRSCELPAPLQMPASPDVGRPGFLYLGHRVLWHSGTWFLCTQGIKQTGDQFEGTQLVQIQQHWVPRASRALGCCAPLDLCTSVLWAWRALWLLHRGVWDSCTLGPRICAQWESSPLDSSAQGAACSGHQAAWALCALRFLPRGHWAPWAPLGTSGSGALGAVHPRLLGTLDILHSVFTHTGHWAPWALYAMGFVHSVHWII